jgi:hypothetical protein
MKPRRMRWEEQEALVGKMRNAYIIWVGNLKGRDHSAGVGVDGRIILKYILAK